MSDMDISFEKLKPQPLPKGGMIAICSPAGPIEKHRLDKGIKTLQVWGYHVSATESAAGRSGYFSASESDRMQDLVEAFSNPEAQAVFCSRGGYGSSRLLRHLPFEKFRENPKLFMGFSDTTALNWALFARSGLITFSGPTVGEIGDGLPEPAQKSLLTMISARQAPDNLWSGSRLKAIRPGKVSGTLFPGCLSIIVTLLGTPFLPDLTNAVLVIEEVNEKPYRIDRMLTHLKNAGVLDKISGIIFGHFIGCWPKILRRGQITLEQILLELTQSNPIPIYSGLPYGHFPGRMTLPVGVQVEVSENSGLRLLEDPLTRQ